MARLAPAAKPADVLMCSPASRARVRLRTALGWLGIYSRCLPARSTLAVTCSIAHARPLPASFRQNAPPRTLGRSLKFLPALQVPEALAAAVTVCSYVSAVKSSYAIAPLSAAATPISSLMIPSR